MKRIILFTSILVLAGCSLNDDIIEYEEKLTVYANLSAGLPMVDPVYVSRTAAIDAGVASDDLRISEAEVYILHDTLVHQADPVADNPGQYLTAADVIYQAGETYELVVISEGDTVRGLTRIPDQLNYVSLAGETYECGGESLPVKQVNVANLSYNLINGELVPAVAGDVDTVVFKTGDCYTQSFASYPYFRIDMNAEPGSTVRILTYALEAEERGLEPFKDANENGLRDSGEKFTDYNRNDVWDSTFTNLIYDTSFVFQIWKGTYLRDENNDPYRYNPFVWNVESTPIPFPWLFFNYYGLHLIVIQSTDTAYDDYFSGDAFGSNQYQLPDSNIEGGYGLFSSTYTSGFFVYLQKDNSDE